MFPKSISLFTLMLYALATFLSIYGMTFKSGKSSYLGLWSGIGAFLCQTIFLLCGFHAYFNGSPSLGAYFQLVAWFILLAGIIAWWRFKNDIFLLFSIPLAFILYLLSMPYIGVLLNLPPFLSLSFYILHIGCLFLSLGIITLGSVSAVIFLTIDYGIKNKKIGMAEKGFPALLILDKINSFSALAAFPLYTIGLIAGFFWANPIFGSFFNADPKKIISLIIWLLLAVLFHNRLAKNWRGRKPAYFIITIFILSFFSIFIVNLFFPTQHNFTINQELMYGF